MTATLAGPPEAQPAMAFEMSMKNWPRPVFSRKAPKRMNRKMKVLETPIGVPKMPSVVKKRCSTRLVDVDAAMRELAREVGAGEGVGDEDEGDDDDGQAHDAPRRLEDEEDADDADDDVEGRRGARALGRAPWSRGP